MFENRVRLSENQKLENSLESRLSRVSESNLLPVVALGVHTKGLMENDAQTKIHEEVRVFQEFEG